LVERYHLGRFTRTPLQVIKGNWQLSGGHKGSRSDDRTSGNQAVSDFQRFVDAGVTTFDTADIYGPSEALIGEYVKKRGGAEGLQLLTKSCKFGGDMSNVSQQSMSQVRSRACRCDRSMIFQCQTNHDYSSAQIAIRPCMSAHTRVQPTSSQTLGAHPPVLLQGITKSLLNLNVASVDLVQFYWHDYSVKKYVSAAQYLMEEVGRGRVKHVGVTNFDVRCMQEMMDSGVSIAAAQVCASPMGRV
jgi:aryl-alcohol dehydrogenase-like predicted oxidoreductase